MRIAGLCEGYGGLTWAVQAALGGELAWVAEYDKAPSKVLAHHWPTVPNLHDVTTIDWSQCEPVDILHGGYPCFTADAMVLTRDGYRPIADIRVGDLVLTHNRRWRPVTALMQKDAPETVVVPAQGTHRVRCTPEHPWWTQRGEWVAAKELSGRRVVQVLPEQEARRDDLTPELLWVLGRHLADGYLQHRRDRAAGSGRITITCAHDETDEVMAGIEAAGLHGYVCRARTATKVAVTRKYVYQLAAQCGQGAENRRVPGWLIAQLDQAGAEALLAGYLSGDGSYHAKNREYRATTISKALAYSMALVAQRARGVVCSVRLNRVPATKVIEGRTVNQRPFWTLSVPDRNRSGKVDGDQAYKHCRTVESAGPARVYNIAVDEDESYVVDNAVVHNCQGFSLAGRRLGVNDPRHLWPHIGPGKYNDAGELEHPGAIATLRPRMFIGENVRGHLSLGFDVVLADLHALGYDVRWTIRRAADDGACHGRARLFFLATDRERNATVRPVGQKLARYHGGGWVEPDEGLFGDIPFTGSLPAAGAMVGGELWVTPSPSTGLNVADVLIPISEAGHALLPTPTASNPNEGETVESWVARRDRELAKHRNGNGIGLPLAMAVRMLDEAPHLLPTHRASDGEKGGPNQRGSKGDMTMPSAAVQMVDGWGGYGPAIRRWEAVIGRPAPAPTVTGQRGGQQLSPAFTEWMMGLPEGHVTGVPGLTRAEQIKMCGNGVVPQQGAAAIAHLAGQVTTVVAA